MSASVRNVEHAAQVQLARTEKAEEGWRHTARPQSAPQLWL
jgi:hypothetical protein